MKDTTFQVKDTTAGMVIALSVNQWVRSENWLKYVHNEIPFENCGYFGYLQAKVGKAEEVGGGVDYASLRNTAYFTHVTAILLGDIAVFIIALFANRTSSGALQ